MKSVSFKVSGMHCNGCAQIIQSVLERNDGVRTCSASFADGVVRILFDPAHIDEGRLAATLERAGYLIADRGK